MSTSETGMPTIRSVSLAFAATAASATIGLAQGEVDLEQLADTEMDLAPQAAQADLDHIDGGRAGTALFTQLPAGLLVEVELENMTEGAHGIHIHETGACTPGFDAANGHAAPEGNSHGFAATETPHVGDLPNVVAGPDGTAAAQFLNERAVLGEGEAAILDVDGAALVVHAEPDDYADPDSSGDRVACGVIRVEG
jgi:superoxide dismutase, Cu-Zn family